MCLPKNDSLFFQIGFVYHIVLMKFSILDLEGFIEKFPVTVIFDAF